MNQNDDGRVPLGEGADKALIYEALRFYFWAAGQGISPAGDQDCLEPEEGFWQFGQRTGDEAWETVAQRYRESDREGVAENDDFLRGVQFATNAAVRHVETHYDSGDRDTYYEQQIAKDLRLGEHLTDAALRARLTK